MTNFRSDSENFSEKEFSMADLNKHISPPGLFELEAAARQENLPIIPKETARFLSVLLSALKPMNILEVGCCVGFSAALMSGYLGEGGHVITIDRYPYMIERAKENFKKLNLTDKVTLLEGDALDILPTLNQTFDFVFIDAAKAHYSEFLCHSLRLTKKGGVLAFDNVLQKGMVFQDRFSVKRRDRTTHSRMRKFLWQITETDGLETSVLPIGDGLALCVKIEDDVIIREDCPYDK